MTSTLNKIEALLEAIASGNDELIPVESVSHVLRVLRAQKEMMAEGLIEEE